MEVLGWLQLVLLIVASGILAGATMGWLSARSWLQRLRKVAPQARFVLISLLAMLPLGLGVLALAISFAPSMLDALGIVADHCGHHGGHAFHLCFIHGQPPSVSPVILGVGLVLALWLLAGWSDEAEKVRRTRSWGDKLLRLGRPDDEIGGWTVATDKPVAVTIGLLEPRVCISDGLRESLSARQFEAVVAHEHAHARRYDSLAKLVVRLSAQLHLPPVRVHLLAELDLACEQACDEAAADCVGDRLTVAEAILAVERSCQGGSLPASALAFGAQPIEQRVHAMLEANWRRPAWWSMALIAAVGTGSILMSYDLLHHAAESLLALAF